jgi:hypothetical protein
MDCLYVAMLTILTLSDKPSVCYFQYWLK